MEVSSCTSGGCGAKIGPGTLRKLLQDLPTLTSDKLMVGFDASDDASVYLLSEELALISTVDFFPPMVEDPYLFGQIAAVNALSDIYAMGGTPLQALNLVCFPQEKDTSILAEMLRGGAEKLREAGVLLCGGHSIYDKEPKYGLSVTGTAHPKHILRNNTPKAGDCLILTKPLGVGLVMAASRVSLAPPDVLNAATDSMKRLNKYAAEKLSKYPVNACTDVTGFGLLVHAAEMAGQDFTLVIDSEALPLLPGAREFASEYLATAAGERNRAFFPGTVSLSGVNPALQELLFDPQTSGGLLISVEAAGAQALCEAICLEDPAACIIGQVTPFDEAPVLIL